MLAHGASRGSKASQESDEPRQGRKTIAQGIGGATRGPACRANHGRHAKRVYRPLRGFWAPCGIGPHGLRHGLRSAAACAAEWHNRHRGNESGNHWPVQFSRLFIYPGRHSRGRLCHIRSSRRTKRLSVPASLGGRRFALPAQRPHPLPLSRFAGEGSRLATTERSPPGLPPCRQCSCRA
jgi:hypothetical protein